jgi:MoxR-like ATPase
MSNVAQSMQEQAQLFRDRFAAVREQIGRVIVGHDEIVNGVLTAMFVGGHCLLEGVPGLGKTMLIRTLSETLSLDFNRIQFTPDLMPSDILGTNMIVEEEENEGSNSRKDRSLRRSVWPMKSTELRLRLNRRCWRRCRKGL